MEDSDMSANSLMLVERPSPFQRIQAQRVMPNQASPIVLQLLVQAITDLNHKVDVLATRPAQAPQVMRQQETTDATASVPEIDKRRLTEIFD